MDDRQDAALTASTVGRREVLQRGAFVAGAAAFWATPVVQTLGARPAAAGSPTGLPCDSIYYVVYQYTGEIDCLDWEVRRAAAGGSGGQSGGTGQLVASGTALGGDQVIRFDVGGGNPDYSFFVKDHCEEGAAFQQTGGKTHLSCSAQNEAEPPFQIGDFTLVGVSFKKKPGDGGEDDFLGSDITAFDNEDCGGECVEPTGEQDFEARNFENDDEDDDDEDSEDKALDVKKNAADNEPPSAEIKTEPIEEGESEPTSASNTGSEPKDEEASE